MKSKRVFMILLLLLLTSCIDLTDPYDRVQGEPTETGLVAEGNDEGGSPANEALDETTGEAEGH